MKFRLQNALLAAFSIGLASLLWFLVSAQERSEIILSVPLEYRNLPHGTELFSTGEMLTKVNVWVRGSSAAIKNLQPNEIRASVDLSGGLGDRIFELTSANVQVPYDFTVLRITPPRVKLRIEQIVSRKVPVMPHLEGKPPEGYALVGTFITPPQVEITGPGTIVNSIKHVITDSIDLSNIKGEYAGRVNIGVEDSAVRLGKTREVMVSLRVSEIQDIITLHRIAVIVQGANKRHVTFDPKMISVDFQAAKASLKQIKQETLRASVDVQDLKPGSYELTPKIVGLDPNLKISTIGFNPKRVHVEIGK